MRTPSVISKVRRLASKSNSCRTAITCAPKSGLHSWIGETLTDNVRPGQALAWQIDASVYEAGFFSKWDESVVNDSRNHPTQSAALK